MYIAGVVWFVLSLKKRYYMRQFSLVSSCIASLTLSWLLKTIVRVDSRYSPDRGYSILLYHPKYVRGIDLVRRPCFHDRHKWLHGISVRILLREDTSNQTVSQENVGGVHRWWNFDCNHRMHRKWRLSRNNCWNTNVVFRFHTSSANTKIWFVRSSMMRIWEKRRWSANQVPYSNWQLTNCQKQLHWCVELYVPDNLTCSNHQITSTVWPSSNHWSLSVCFTLIGTVRVFFRYWSFRWVLRIRLQKSLQDQRFWRHNSRPWRYHGQIRLSVLNGNIRERVHQQFHPMSFTSEIVSTSYYAESRWLEKDLHFHRGTPPLFGWTSCERNFHPRPLVNFNAVIV